MKLWEPRLGGGLKTGVLWARLRRTLRSGCHTRPGDGQGLLLEVMQWEALEASGHLRTHPVKLSLPEVK